MITYSTISVKLRLLVQFLLTLEDGMSKGNRMTKGEKAQRWLTEQSPFPSKLRRLMEKNGVTQKELAEAIGVTRQSVSMYAGGQTVPDIYTVQLIADYFNVSVSTLLGDQGIIRCSRDFQEICTAYAGPDFYELVLNILRLTDEGIEKVAARVEELREIPKYCIEYHELQADRQRKGED